MLSGFFANWRLVSNLVPEPPFEYIAVNMKRTVVWSVVLGIALAVILWVSLDASDEIFRIVFEAMNVGIVLYASQPVSNPSFWHGKRRAATQNPASCAWISEGIHGSNRESSTLPFFFRLCISGKKRSGKWLLKG